MNQDIKKRLYSKAVKDGDCLIWQGARRHKARGENSYGIISWKGKNWATHRLSYFLHHKGIDDAFYVLHSCNRPLCINPNHLTLGSALDNALDCKNANRQTRNYDERNGACKLKPADVLFIRNEVLAGCTQSSLAKQFGVSPATIHNIVHKKRRSHI